MKVTESAVAMKNGVLQVVVSLFHMYVKCMFVGQHGF